VITWTKEVPAGETVTVSFKVKVGDVNGTAITNTATVQEGKNTYSTNGVSNPTDRPYEPETPNTGDNSNIQLWFTMLCISCLGLGALALSGTKKEESENG